MKKAHFRAKQLTLVFLHFNENATLIWASMIVDGVNMDSYMLTNIIDSLAVGWIYAVAAETEHQPSLQPSTQ